MDTSFLLERVDVFNRDIETLDLSQPLSIHLIRTGKKRIGQLSAMNLQDFVEVYHLGKEYYEELVEKLYALGIKPIELKEDEDHITLRVLNDYPQNLISAINNMSMEANMDYWSIIDIRQGLSIALSTLPEREETMVLLRYKYCVTLEKIGGYYGLSKERARQIINEALQKLAEKSRRRFFEKGLKYYLDSEAELRARNIEESILRNEYNRGYEDGYENCKKIYGITQIPVKLLQEPIERLDLSVKAFNVLKRAGANTVGDLLTYCEAEDIMRIRNMGKRSVQEIANKLNEYGICNKAWKDFLDNNYEPV